MKKNDSQVKGNRIKVDRMTYEKFSQRVERLEDELHIVNLRKRAAYCDGAGEGSYAPEFQNLENEALRIRAELKRSYEEIAKLVVDTGIMLQQSDENTVSIGDVVRITMTDTYGEEEILFKLVIIDGNLTNEIQEVSTESQVGAAVLGKKVNDKFVINIGSEETEIFIKEIVEKGIKNSQKEKSGPVRKRTIK